MKVHVPFKYNTCPLCTQKNIANGMGPSGMWYTRWLKKFSFSKRFKNEANIHDDLYHLGGDEKDRKCADTGFKKGMTKHRKKEVKGFWKNRTYQVEIYIAYLIVKIKGKKFFNYGGCCNG